MPNKSYEISVVNDKAFITKIENVKDVQRILKANMIYDGTMKNLQKNLPEDLDLIVYSQESLSIQDNEKQSYKAVTLMLLTEDSKFKEVEILFSSRLNRALFYKISQYYVMLEDFENSEKFITNKFASDSESYAKHVKKALEAIPKTSSTPKLDQVLMLEQDGAFVQNPIIDNMKIFYYKNYDKNTESLVGSYYSPDEKTIKYEGQMKEGLINGSGKLYLKNNGCYEGKFEDGLKNFQGTYKPITEDSDILSLECKITDEKIVGDVTILYQNTNIYKGSLKDFQADGQGVLYFQDSTGNDVKYEGEFKKGAFNGKGKMTLRNGSIYDGEWVNNIKEGFGVLTFPAGSEYLRYEGDFKNDLQIGEGKMICQNGEEIVINHKDGLMKKVTLPGTAGTNLGLDIDGNTQLPAMDDKVKKAEKYLDDKLSVDKKDLVQQIENVKGRLEGKGKSELDNINEKKNLMEKELTGVKDQVIDFNQAPKVKRIGDKKVESAQKYCEACIIF